jgi:hypothetical protein
MYKYDCLKKLVTNTTRMRKTFAGLKITLDAIHCDNYEISFVSYIYLMQAILIFTCWFIYRHTANYSDYTESNQIHHK